ncbi:MAG: group III truncated hemoglobin [Bacteroidia bacterium]
MTKEIMNLDDIKVLVDVFYSKVRKDELLATVFEDKLKDRWPQHLEKMYRFWQTVLLDEHTYNGSPFAPHAQLPIEKEHFERWISLFYETIEENFTGNKAEEAKWRAEKMAEMFYHKHAYFKNNPSKLII